MSDSRVASQRPAIFYTVLAVLAGALPVIGWLGGSFWFFDLFNHFQLQYAVFIAAMVLLLLCRKAWRLAALASLFLMVVLIRIVPLLLPSGGEAAGNPLRLATFNVLTSNQSYKDVLDWVRTTDPDLIFFPEADERWAKELSPLLASHPYKLEHFEGGNFGSVFHSKLPILDREIIPCGSSGLPYLKVKLQRGESSFTFYGAHPIPPVGEVNSKDRNDYLKAMAGDVAGEDGVVIVAGDLNATPWSHSMKPLLATGLQGSSLSPTWRRGNPLLAIPIDWLLYRGPSSKPDGIRCSKRWVGPDLGSDHRPVVADLVW